MKNISTCIAAYYCDATGFNTGSKQLIDQSGYGNHLDIKLLTAPVYANRAGHQVMDFDNTYYFEGQNLLQPGGSVVVVGCVSLDAVDGVLHVVATASRSASVGNFDGVPNETTDAEWFTAKRQKQVFFYGNSPRMFENSGIGAEGADFVAGAMNLFTGAISLNPAQLQGATKTQVPAIAAFGAGATASAMGSHVRLGFLKTAGGLAATRYMGIKRVYFFAGNVFNHPDFATKRASEIAAFGI